MSNHNNINFESFINSDKFKKEFNWKPRFNNLNIILSSALNWERNNS